MSLCIEVDSVTHFAMVSVRQSGDEMICVVRYFDNQLYYKLPDHMLVFTLSGELKHPPENAKECVAKLMGSTAEAISRQLRQNADYKRLC